MDGFSGRHLAGFYLFAAFGPSQYIFLFYEETQRLRRRLTEWSEPSHLIRIGGESLEERREQKAGKEQRVGKKRKS